MSRPLERSSWSDDGTSLVAYQMGSPTISERPSPAPSTSSVTGPKRPALPTLGNASGKVGGSPQARNVTKDQLGAGFRRRPMAPTLSSASADRPSGSPRAVSFQGEAPNVEIEGRRPFRLRHLSSGPGQQQQAGNNSIKKRGGSSQLRVSAVAMTPMATTESCQSGIASFSEGITGVSLENLSISTDYLCSEAAASEEAVSSPDAGQAAAAAAPPSSSSPLSTQQTLPRRPIAVTAPISPAAASAIGTSLTSDVGQSEIVPWKPRSGTAPLRRPHIPITRSCSNETATVPKVGVTGTGASQTGNNNNNTSTNTNGSDTSNDCGKNTTSTGSGARKPHRTGSAEEPTLSVQRNSSVRSEWTRISTACSSSDTMDLGFSCSRGLLRSETIAASAATYFWLTRSSQKANVTSGAEVELDLASAVLILGESSNPEPILKEAADAVEKVSQGRSLVPILVILLDLGDEVCNEEESPFDCRAALEVQQKLLGLKVDDVLCNRSSWGALRLDIKMAVSKANVRRHRLAQYKKHLEKREKQLETSNARVQDLDDMVWQLVPNTFPQFPVLDWDLDVNLEPGAQVGPAIVEQKLNKGSVGTVYLAKATDNGASPRLEALKVMEKHRLQDLDMVASLYQEIRTLEKLDHGNIIELYGTLHGQNHIILRMGYIGSQNMFQAMRKVGGRFSLQVAFRLFSQLSSGIAHCHGKNVAHRDLKPENIVVSDDCSVLKIVDFGCSTPADEASAELVGTMPFMAPELLDCSESSKYVPAGVDIWALGVILLELFGGIGQLNKLLGWKDSEAPERARASELRAFFQANANPFGPLVEATLGSPNPELVTFLRGMLTIAPSGRSTAAQVDSFRPTY